MHRVKRVRTAARLGAALLFAVLALPPVFASAAAGQLLTGTVVLVAVDGFDPVSGKPWGRLERWLRLADGSALRLADGGAADALPNGSRVRVRGRVHEALLEADEVEPLATAALAAGPATVGAQRTLVALVQFPDLPGAGDPRAEVASFFYTAVDSVAAFYREASQERAWFLPDPAGVTAAQIVGWVTTANASTSYSSWGGLIADAVAALDPQVDFAAVDRLVLIFSGAPPYESAAVAGRGTVGPTTITTADGTVALSVGWSYGVWKDVVAHELGHNFGFMHASSVWCLDTPSQLPVSLLDPGFSCGTGPFLAKEYGDADDVMGGEGIQHFSAWWKAQAGWFDGPAEAAVGTSVVTLVQAELASAGTRALRVPVGLDDTGAPSFYWVEYRPPAGLFDYAGGVQVRLRQSNTALSAAPGAPAATGLANCTVRIQQGSAWSAVAPGAPFVDPYRGVRLTLLGTSGAGAAAQAQVRAERSGLVLQPEGVLGFAFLPYGVGRVQAQVVTVRNDGAATISFTAPLAVGGRNAGDFAVTGTTCGETLPAAASCTVIVAFSPLGGGLRLATLEAATDDPLRPLPALTLRGTGVLSGRSRLEPVALVFGATGQGAFAPRQPVTLTNEGNAPLSITSVSVDGDGFCAAIDGGSCTPGAGLILSPPVELVPGGSWAFEVGFSPQSVIGAVSGTAWIDTGAPADNYAVSLPLAGTAVQGHKTLTVTNLTPLWGRVYSVDPATYQPDGKIDCGLGAADCADEYPFQPEGWAVRLYAEPAAGYEFDAWSGECNYPFVTSCSIIPNREMSVTASFKRRPNPTNLLNVGVSGSFGYPGPDCPVTVSLGGPNAWTFVPGGPTSATLNVETGVPVTVTATPAKGCFATWMKNSFGCSGRSPCTTTFPRDGYLWLPLAVTANGKAAVDVVRPAAGSVVASGGLARVRWSAPAWTNHFSLEYSLDGGKRWTLAADALPGSGLVWHVPVPPGGNRDALVRVKAHPASEAYLPTQSDPTIGAGISGAFRIEVLRLLAPEGGILASGDPLDVSWRVNAMRGKPAAIVVSLSDGPEGTSWTQLARITPPATSWRGAVPTLPPGTPAQRLVKVAFLSSTGAVLAQDASDAPFTILP